MVILRPTKGRKRGLYLSLKHSNQISWLCIRDYNEITSSFEKAGGNIILARQMDRFRRVIHHCAFQDLGFVGLPFRWSKNNDEEGRIWLSQTELLQIMNGMLNFRELLCTILLCPHPITLFSVLWFPHIRLQPQGGVKLFRFEAMWLQDPQCDKVVQEAQQEGLYRPGGC